MLHKCLGTKRDLFASTKLKGISDMETEGSGEIRLNPTDDDMMIVGMETVNCEVRSR